MIHESDSVLINPIGKDGVQYLRQPYKSKARNLTSLRQAQFPIRQWEEVQLDNKRPIF